MIFAPALVALAVTPAPPDPRPAIVELALTRRIGAALARTDEAIRTSPDGVLLGVVGFLHHERTAPEIGPPWTALKPMAVGRCGRSFRITSITSPWVR